MAIITNKSDKSGNEFNELGWYSEVSEVSEGSEGSPQLELPRLIELLEENIRELGGSQYKNSLEELAKKADAFEREAFDAKMLAQDADANALKHKRKFEDKQQELQKVIGTVRSGNHDLRMCIDTILGFARLYGSELPNSEDWKQYHSTILSASAMALSILDDISAFMRLGDVTLNKTLFKCRRLVNESMLAANTAYPVVLKAEPVLPNSIYADRELISRVFQNLFSNAYKFRKEQDEAAQLDIECWVDTARSEHVFSVKDYGIGIENEKLQKIWTAGYRTTGQNPNGTGLGLAIVKEIIEKHDGRVWAESARGEYSRFYFTLPLCEQTEQKEEQ